jgi:hypothetical protein
MAKLIFGEITENLMIQFFGYTLILTRRRLEDTNLAVLDKKKSMFFLSITTLWLK